MLRRAHDTFGEEDHLIDGNGQRVVVAANDIAGAVAHKQHVDARFVHQRRKGEIITGQHGDFLAVDFHLTQFGRCHPAILYMYTHNNLTI